MAVSKCGSCGGSYFEVVAKEPRNSKYKILFVQCTNCGVVVGVTEFMNAGALLRQAQETLDKIERRIR